MKHPSPRSPRTTPPPLPVFVYGTLLAGEKNHAAYLAGRYLARQAATARGRLFFEPEGGYPLLLPGTGLVRGELYQLAPATYDETLAALDALEEYDPRDETRSVYLRRKTRVVPEGQPACRAWVYYWNGPTGAAVPVPGGSFADWLRDR